MSREGWMLMIMMVRLDLILYSMPLDDYVVQ